METIKRVGLVILFVVWHALCGSATARPNIQRLNPTGYSLEVAYDNTPFFTDGQAVYALPKGLKVQILAMKGMQFAYCQLPDGSRGLVPIASSEGTPCNSRKNSTTATGKV